MRFWAKPWHPESRHSCKTPGSVILLFCTLLTGYAQAAVHRIPEGVNGIAQAAQRAAAGDTLMLTTSGGRYRETDRVALPAVLLTIMAAPDLLEKPVWTTEGTRHLRAYADITIAGVVFDGERNTQYAIRSYAQKPNRIVIENCIFRNIVRDAVTDNDVPVAGCTVRNSLFHNIGAAAIEFRTGDMCPDLTVENCTFSNIGELAIMVAEKDVPARVRIANVTICNALGGIYLNNISDAQVRNSILSKCRIYGIRALKPAVLSKICTHDNWEDFDLVTPGADCFRADPQFFEPDRADFSLLPDSPCLNVSGVHLGDLRWTGSATLRAGRTQKIRSAGRALGYLGMAIGFGFGIFWLSQTLVRRQERRKADKALRDSEAKYRDLFESAYDAILLVHQNGDILDVNRRGEQLSGHSRERLLKMNMIRDLVVEEDRPIIRRTLKQVRGGAECVCEVRWQNAEGNVLHLEGATTPQMTLEGDFVSARFIFRDITERRKTERELIRLERLRSLGEMSAGVSHNLNNMLCSILLPAEIIQHKATDPDILRHIETIQKSGRRAADLVKRLHESVREKKSDLDAVNIHEVIREVVQTTRLRWQDQAQAEGRHIEIALDLHDVPHVGATESGLHEVLTNLILNAVDAMPQGGTITLGTEQVGNRARITVRDTGIGMNDQTRSRIFEPFFTTKVTVGTGLGLSTVYGQVTRWGGDIAVESAVGQGATFYIDLPIWRENAEAPSPHNLPDYRTETRRHILVVDDEDAIRIALKQALKSAFEVETCSDGAAALTLLREMPFDVALIDLGLPGQAGDEVARMLKNEAPDLVTVLITGWQLENGDPRLAAFDLQLRKPFYDLAAVHKVLQQALLIRLHR